MGTRLHAFIILVPLLLTAGSCIAGEIHQAAAVGDTARVAAAVGANPESVGERDSDGATALHHAVWNKHEAVVRFLIENYAPVNAANRKKVTPLHVAAASGSPEIISLLLEASANPNARDSKGRTPFDVAQASGRRNIASLLKAPSQTPTASPANTRPKPSPQQVEQFAGRGSLTVRVRDRSGSALEGAVVSVGRRQLETNQRGEALLEDLAPGVYTVTVKLPNGRALGSQRVMLRGGETAQIELTAPASAVAKLSGQSPAQTGQPESAPPTATNSAPPTSMGPPFVVSLLLLAIGIAAAFLVRRQATSTGPVPGSPEFDPPYREHPVGECAFRCKVSE